MKNSLYYLKTLIARFILVSLIADKDVEQFVTLPKIICLLFCLIKCTYKGVYIKEYTQLVVRASDMFDL